MRNLQKAANILNLLIENFTSRFDNELLALLFRLHEVRPVCAVNLALRIFGQPICIPVLSLTTQSILATKTYTIPSRRPLLPS